MYNGSLSTGRIAISQGLKGLISLSNSNSSLVLQMAQMIYIQEVVKYYNNLIYLHVAFKSILKNTSIDFTYHFSMLSRRKHEKMHIIEIFCIKLLISEIFLKLFVCNEKY